MLRQTPAHSTCPTRRQIRQRRHGQMSWTSESCSCKHGATGTRHAAVAESSLEKPGSLRHFATGIFCGRLQIVATPALQKSCRNPVASDVCKKARKYSSFGVPVEERTGEDRRGGDGRGRLDD